MAKNHYCPSIWDEYESHKCPHCENLASAKPHICPYRAEIGHDEEYQCYCCEECTKECAMDI